MIYEQPVKPEPKPKKKAEMFLEGAMIRFFHPSLKYAAKLGSQKDFAMLLEFGKPL